MSARAVDDAGHSIANHVERSVHNWIDRRARDRVLAHEHADRFGQTHRPMLRRQQKSTRSDHP